MNIKFCDLCGRLTTDHPIPKADMKNPPYICFPCFMKLREAFQPYFAEPCTDEHREKAQSDDDHIKILEKRIEKLERAYESSRLEQMAREAAKIYSQNASIEFWSKIFR